MSIRSLLGYKTRDKFYGSTGICERLSLLVGCGFDSLLLLQMSVCKKIIDYTGVNFVSKYSSHTMTDPNNNMQDGNINDARVRYLTDMLV